MSEPFIGEIRMFAGNYAPRGWAFCNGQSLAIAQNSALFAVLGTTYGGDGRNNFMLPNLQGRTPIHAGTDPGLSPRALGQKGGSESTTLAIANLPSHTHPAVFTPGPPTQLNVTATTGTLLTPVGNMLAQSPSTGPTSALLYAPADSTVSGQLAGMSAGSNGGTVAVGAIGGNMPVPTVPPFLAVSFIIALMGIYPPRT